MRRTKRQAIVLLSALLLGSTALLPTAMPAMDMGMSPTAHAQEGGSGDTGPIDPAREKQVDSIAQQLMCQCGCGLTVFNCGNAMSCTISPQMREQIGSMVDEGKTKAGILDYFIGIYGEKVLAAPKKSGFGLSAWVTPFAGMGAGVVLVGLVLYSWARRRSAPQALPVEGEAAVAPPPETDLESYRDRVERDLEELDRS